MRTNLKVLPRMPERALLCLAFVAPLILALPLVTTGLPFLDDNNLGATHNERGFWGPTLALHELSAFYRPLATLLVSFVYVVPGHLAWARWLGLALHGLSVVALSSAWRRIGGSASGVAVLVAVHGLYLYSLEAIGWPAALVAYPIALAILSCGTWLIVVAERRRGVAAGAAVVASALLAQEQLLPFVGLVLLSVIIMRRRALVPTVGGAALPLALFVASIAASAGKAVRFSGDNGASVRHVVDNLGFLPNYGEALPGGHVWLSTAGIGAPRLFAAGILGVVTVGAWLLAPERRPLASQSVNAEACSFASAVARHPAALPIGAITCGLACTVAALAALLASPAPYVTPRTLYFPVLGLSLVAAGIVEGASRRWPRPGLVPAIVALPLLPLAAFSAAGLSAEASAYRQQLRVNRAQLQELLADEPLRPLTLSGKRLIVANFPPTSVKRPLFGEHIVGLNPADLGFAATSEGLAQNDVYSVLDFRSGLVGLCHEHGRRFALLPTWLALAPQKWADVDLRHDVIFAIWDGTRWTFQRGDSGNALAGELAAQGLPACPSS